MRKKLFAMLLATALALNFGSVAAYAGRGPDPPSMNPKETNTFNLPVRYRINQASSVNPETTLWFECYDRLYYTDPDDDAPQDDTEVAFPDVTVPSLTFSEGEATLAGAVRNAVFTIPAVTKCGVYEYLYGAVFDHQSAYPDFGSFKLRIYVFNGPGPDSKQMVAEVWVMGEEPVIDPESGEASWIYTKVDELGVEYRAYEYAITKDVAGNLGDRNKEFEFTVRLRGAWYRDFWPGDPDHNEANGYPHVTISYSGGESVSGSFKLEGGEGGEITTTSTVINAGLENEYTLYTHSFDKTVTFKLRDGETVTFTNLPESNGLGDPDYGTVITVTETDCSRDGYVTTIGGEERRTESYTIWCPEPVMDHELDVPAPVTDPETGEIVYQYGNGSVTVVNTKEGIIDSGVILEYLPYVIVIVFVIACGIVFFVVKNRRGSEEYSFDDEV